MRQYLDSMQTTYNALGGYGFKLGEIMFVERILTSLPSCYEGLVNAANAATVTKIPTLYSILCPKDQDRVVEPKTPTDIKTLNTEVKKKKNNKQRKKCGHCQKGYHQEKNCWAKNPHLRPKLDNSQTNVAQAKMTPASNSVRVSEEVQDFKGFATTTPTKTTNHDLMLDSGANACVTNRKELLWNFRLAKSQVSVESSCGNRSAVEGVGDLHLLDGEVILTNVLYVPSVQKTLIATNTLRDQGLYVLMAEETVITNRARKIHIHTYDKNGLTFILWDKCQVIKSTA
jgi:hypothetical protein